MILLFLAASRSRAPSGVRGRVAAASKLDSLEMSWAPSSPNMSIIVFCTVANMAPAFLAVGSALYWFSISMDLPPSSSAKRVTRSMSAVLLCSFLPLITYSASLMTFPTGTISSADMAPAKASIPMSFAWSMNAFSSALFSVIPSLRYCCFARLY